MVHHHYLIRQEEDARETLGRLRRLASRPRAAGGSGAAFFVP